MTELERESEILRRAVAAGYLLNEDLIEAERAVDAPTPRRQSAFGPRVEVLLQRGKLNQTQLQLLSRAGSNEALERTGPPIDSNHELGRGALPAADSNEAQAILAASAKALALGDTIASTGMEPAAPAVASSPQFPVENWNRYEFVKLLGQGGMGAVYQARDRRLNRIVALKFIRGGDEQMTRRFMQEARAQSRVEHPGICQVYDVGEVSGKAYIAMQFIDGLTLAQSAKQLSMLEKVQVVKDAAEALHAAHELGIIHREHK